MSYIIVFKNEKDISEIRVSETKEGIEAFLKFGEGRELQLNEFALIEGKVIKSFENETVILF